MIKIIMIALLALTLTNCAKNTYKVEQEAKDETRVLNQVIVLNLSFIGYLLALSFAIDFRPKILPAFVQGFED